MANHIAVIKCKTCNKELTRIEAHDPEVTEPDVFVPQVYEMMQIFCLPDEYCQDCRNKR